ncbi:hypothetical protein CTI12_AA550710 [Artemisia annua]|uniref:Nucleoporin Nup159/Nup146 N-terminal domain-containing protein n=1 Tax=Artemisia annua TaxID=35608 RepID=A0A2U1KYH7_ARTAN|nr:hypothetical protein CTI12_AA550710 [Artemisia annua]
MAEADVIKITTELEGDRDGTSNYRFSRLGEPVPVTSDENFTFDIENLPSRPFALSERFGAVFVAHLNAIIEAVTVPIELLGFAVYCIEAVTAPNEMLGFAVSERFGVVFIARLNGERPSYAVFCYYKVYCIEAVTAPNEMLGFAVSERFGVVFIAHLNGNSPNYAVSMLLEAVIIMIELGFNVAIFEAVTIELGLFVVVVVDGVRELIELVIVVDAVIVLINLALFVMNQNAKSQRVGVVFYVAYLNGFCVAKTKDVISTAKALKEGSEGSSIQELSIVDVPLGKVSILALSADSSTLAASAGSNIYFFSVAGLLNKDREPSFSKSINGSSCVKDMHWSPHSENKYVVLTSAGKLYGGAGQNDLSSLLDDVDAVNWSMNGKYLAVAKHDCLIILSSKFKEKVRIKLLFDSLVDGDADCVVKVDSIRWVRPDCIVLGCYCLSADGKEENHTVQLITVKDGKITDTSSNPVALTFSSPYLAINEDDIPSGSGPYTLVSYLDEFELAFVANKRNTSEHIVLFVWSPDNENGAEMLDIIGGDAWMPTIDLANGDDANMILGLAIDKVNQNENDIVVCGEKETEVSPCCILMCLTVDGKLFLFHFASAVGPSVLPEEVNSVSDEEEESTLSSSQLIKDQALSQSQAQTLKVNEPTRDEQTKSTASSQLFISSTQQDVPVVRPNNSKDQWQSPASQKQDGKSEPVKSGAMFKDFKATTESPGNKVSFSFNDSSGSFSSGSIFSSNVFGVPTSSSAQTVVQGSAGLSGKIASASLPVQSRFSKTFDVKSSQPPHAAVQANRPDTSVAKFSFSKMTSGPSASSISLPPGAQTGAALTRSLPNAQPKLENLRHHTPSRLSNSESNLSEQHSVEDMAKELDALLDSIERPGGFYYASVAAHEPSVATLEEGIQLLSDRCQTWTVGLEVLAVKAEVGFRHLVVVEEQ